MATDSEDNEGVQETAPSASLSQHGDAAGNTESAPRTETGQRNSGDNEDEDDGEDENEDSEEDDEDDDDDEEPKLKYARMTGHLTQVYRNGDATSCFLVAGDKMFVGTHNGNIHVLSLPTFEPLRVYHAHSASISSISISPFPPPINSSTLMAKNRIISLAQNDGASAASGQTSPAAKARGQNQPLVPNTVSNAIHIATSSIDGHVCVASLVDIKDVQLRNFARPVQAVALSPEYRNDKTYISGGTAGNLVLTVGGKSGISSTSSTTGTVAAAASGWLGTIGLGGDHGKDTVLHSGEGIISTIKWSLSGKYVVWVNEQGIKIMRSHIDLDAVDSDSAWKRIAHIDRPQEDGWEEMAGVWKARAEWIDEKSLEVDKAGASYELSSLATSKPQQAARKIKRSNEKLVIGWGSTIWIIKVLVGGVGVGKHAGERSVGRAEITKILRMDCIISGLSLYTPSLLLVLAYITPEDDESEKHPSPKGKGHRSEPSTASADSQQSSGIRRRMNARPPELRLIDLTTSEEVETDGLTVGRSQSLSATDYHLSVLPAAQAPTTVLTSKGTLETLAGMGSGMWNATINATSLLSSAQSILSVGGSSAESSQTGTIVAKRGTKPKPAHPNVTAPGMKIFIHSPYDCILATKRDLADHLAWLLEQEKYEEGWKLLDKHPETISSSAKKLAEIGPGTPERTQAAVDDFYEDDASIRESASRLIDSSVEKEKRRIGELWIEQLIKAGDWTKAGEVCGKVLGNSARWEHWVWTFAGANKFDDIATHIPTTQLQPPLPSTIYEVVLGHYIASDRPRLKELLDLWPPELFQISSVTEALENQLKYCDVREDAVDDGIKGRDWRIITESLGELYIAGGRPREALKCYIQLQDASTAMKLIKDYHLVDAVADDIPGLLLLRVSKEEQKEASQEELEAATAEVIALLVEEAQHGLVRPEIVVSQLQKKDMQLYLFFYLRALWNGDGLTQEQSPEVHERMVQEGRAQVDEFADLAVSVFATFDRPLLMEFLKTSTSYTFEKATAACEELDFIPELVYLYSKIGQTKRALFLIIDRLGDVTHAISFAKQQDDTDLWDDLLDYSMDKPRFIRGLLEEVGTAIDPIKLVRRIPEGLAIEGLKQGLTRILREYDIQHSISEGVAKVLRGEVTTAQDTLRLGQRKGVKFDVVVKTDEHIDLAIQGVPIAPDPVNDIKVNNKAKIIKTSTQVTHKPGHCVGCKEAFTEMDMETLVGFACGHVFHLSHLLSYKSPEKQPMTPPEEEDGMARWENSDMHSIGNKVTYARLLKDKIQGGCPVCHAEPV